MVAPGALTVVVVIVAELAGVMMLVAASDETGTTVVVAAEPPQLEHGWLTGIATAAGAPQAWATGMVKSAAEMVETVAQLGAVTTVGRRSPP